MKNHVVSPRIRLTVVLLIVFGGLVPIASYRWVIGRVPSVAAEDANGRTDDADAQRAFAHVPFRETSLVEQVATVVAAFVIKPVYTLLALVLTVVLWRQKSPDLTALCWAFLFFFVGENFCAANYLIYREQSHLFEYLHNVGMVVCFGLTTYAVLEGLDRRVVKFSDAESRCAALTLCRRCMKYTDAPCALKRLFLLMIPVLMILAFVPLAADVIPLSYNTEIFGSPHNYSHPVIGQRFEIRYCPAVALVMLTVSLTILQFKRNDAVVWSKVFFAAGVGALGFSVFRLVFVQVYRQNLAWYAFWEEATEFLFILTAAAVLWLFRQGLFGNRSRSQAKGL